jgi:hypothetical protein
MWRPVDRTNHSRIPAEAFQILLRNTYILPKLAEEEEEPKLEYYRW